MFSGGFAPSLFFSAAPSDGSLISFSRGSWPIMLLCPNDVIVDTPDSIGRRDVFPRADATLSWLGATPSWPQRQHVATWCALVRTSTCGQMDAEGKHDVWEWLGQLRDEIVCGHHNATSTASVVQGRSIVQRLRASIKVTPMRLKRLINAETCWDTAVTCCETRAVAFVRPKAHEVAAGETAVIGTDVPAS